MIRSFLTLPPPEGSAEGSGLVSSWLVGADLRQAARARASKTHIPGTSRTLLVLEDCGPDSPGNGSVTRSSPSDVLSSHSAPARLSLPPPADLCGSQRRGEEQPGACRQEQGSSGEHQDGAASRTALGDIGNRVALQKQASAKKVVVEEGCGWQPGTEPGRATSLAKTATRNTRRAASKKKPESRPEHQPEPTQDNAVSRRNLQMVGVIAMFIASKYEEILHPDIVAFIYATDHTYTRSQICVMEMKILQALDFSLGHPLPPHFLRRASKIAEMDLEQHILAKYLMELSSVDYDMVHFPPSQTAAAASCLALKLLSGCKWTTTLQYYTSYTESDLLPVMQHMAKNIILVNEGITKHMVRISRCRQGVYVKCQSVVLRSRLS
ncbi:G2/mitotic-specific cyclin-B1 [Podargus strigoides]